jgi:P4 family phage/plasmid primase-like protien
MQTAKGELLAFLHERRSKKSAQCTHLGMAPNLGKFFIPDADYSTFMDLYVKAVEANVQMCIIERHRIVGQVAIDLDVVYKNTHADAQSLCLFDDDFIAKFVEPLANTIKSMVEIDSDVDSSLVYVFRKPDGVAYNSETKNFKDGLHIMMPNIVTEPFVQKLLRQTMLPHLQNIVDELPDCFQIVSKIEDIYDESVIERNGWMMYGSRKEGKPAYGLYQLWNFPEYPKIQKMAKHVMHLYSSEYQLTHATSIRRHNPGDANVLSDNCRTDLERMRKESAARIKGKVNSAGTACNYSEDIEFVKGLVQMLNISRAENHDDWKWLGFCLHNIDDRLLDTWVEFSKLSERHTEDEATASCTIAWATMNSHGLGIATLIKWAKDDNQDNSRFREFMNQSLETAVVECCEKFMFTETKDIGDGKIKKTETMAKWSSVVYYILKVLHKLWRHTLVCSAPTAKSPDWWEFVNHRWTRCALGLKKYLSEDAYFFFSKMSQKYNQDKTRILNRLSVDPHSNELLKKKARYEMLEKACGKLAENMRHVENKAKVAKEGCDKFYWQDTNSSDKKYNDSFESVLDSRRNIIGLENGVYDLDTLTFRNGQSEDYVCKSTGNDWKPDYSWENPTIQDIMRFVNQVLPEKQTREYVLLLFASFCDGCPEEKFHIFIGSGGNGKSKLLELLFKSLGDYCGTLPVTALTGQRTQSSGATPEIERLKGKRFVQVNEPGQKECLQAGRLKEMTGGDSLYARALNKDPIEFKPQFNMVMPSNVLPAVPADDNGIWRRVKVVRFMSKFIENPDPDNPCEFKLDTTLSEKFDDWGGPFFWILMQYYTKLTSDLNGKNPEPIQVTDETQAYREQNDHISKFQREKLQCDRNDTKGAFLPLNDLYPQYVNWSKTQGFPLLDRATLRDYFIKNFGDTTKKDGNVEGWAGMKLL